MKFIRTSIGNPSKDLMTDGKAQPPTNGFTQVWLDNLKFSIFAWLGFGSGLDKQIWALVLNFN